MRRAPEDFFEELLRRATQREQQGQQDDVVIHYVVLKDGTEVKVVERRTEIQFIADPEDAEATIPITVSHLKYRLDDNGMPFQKMKEVASCRYGCIVRANTVFICHLCRGSLCRRHALFVGKRTYCRKLRSLCYAIGKPYQILWLAYRAIRYCFRSVTGLNAETSDYTYSDSEESLFDSSSASSYEDLSDDERR